MRWLTRALRRYTCRRRRYHLHPLSGGTWLHDQWRGIARCVYCGELVDVDQLRAAYYSSTAGRWIEVRP